MARRVRIMFGSAVIVCAVLAAAASPAFATVWDVSRAPFGPVKGHVAVASATTFSVTTAGGTKVGRVVKAASGRWSVFRGATKIAIARNNGTRAYPVKLYNLNGRVIGCCGLVHGAWQVCRVSQYVSVILDSVSKGCPGRAAIGAVRLVDWR